MLRIVGTVLRLLLGAVFAFSGLVKAIDPLGTQYKITDYFTAWNVSIGDTQALILAILLIVVEFTIGAFLVLGVLRKWASVGALAFMIVMTPITLWLAVTNEVADCGCFGDAILLTNWQTFAKNVVLLALAIAVIWLPDKVFSPLRIRRLLALLSPIGIAALIGHCIYWLPLVDFMPFSVGSDIREKMEFPADGTMPEILDFCIETLEGEDVTDEILDSKEAILLVAPFLQNAAKGDSTEYNRLYRASEGKDFYCLTASSEEEIARWRQETGAEYAIYHADDIMLKTMIRSNPGIIRMEKGVVTGKWNHHSLPLK